MRGKGTNSNMREINELGGEARINLGEKCNKKELGKKEMEK